MGYQQETKNCQNCKNNFRSESDDFLFYEKIKVPPPTFCQSCYGCNDCIGSVNLRNKSYYIFNQKYSKEKYLEKYVQHLSIVGTKDSYDYTGWGNGSSLLYECSIVGEGAYNNKFCSECWPNAQNIEYSYYCVQGKDCFGCVNLKRKQYCILNKQYTKEEYLKLKKKIIENIEPINQHYIKELVIIVREK